MSTLMRALAALAVAAASLVLTAPGASALSCVAPSDFFPDAEHVFVGRIADVQGDRIRFEVREVWQGEDLAASVWLRRQTDLDMWWSFSRDGEVPQGYSSPKQYVVAADADLSVNPCSLAAADGSHYGVAGADSPRPPVIEDDGGQAGEEPEPSTAPLVAGGVGAAGVLATLVLAWRRRSR